MWKHILYSCISVNLHAIGLSCDKKYKSINVIYVQWTRWSDETLSTEYSLLAATLKYLYRMEEAILEIGHYRHTLHNFFNRNLSPMHYDEIIVRSLLHTHIDTHHCHKWMSKIFWKLCYFFNRVTVHQGGCPVDPRHAHSWLLKRSAVVTLMKSNKIVGLARCES